MKVDIFENSSLFRRPPSIHHLNMVIFFLKIWWLFCLFPPKIPLYTLQRIFALPLCKILGGKKLVREANILKCKFGCCAYWYDPKYIASLEFFLIEKIMFTWIINNKANFIIFMQDHKLFSMHKFELKILQSRIYIRCTLWTKCMSSY